MDPGQGSQLPANYLEYFRCSQSRYEEPQLPLAGPRRDRRRVSNVTAGADPALDQSLVLQVPKGPSDRWSGHIKSTHQLRFTWQPPRR